MQQSWPKRVPPLTHEEECINHDFVQYWHQVLAGDSRYRVIERFNHGYAIKNAPTSFVHTLEIGAGLGEHLSYEKLSPLQKKHYVAIDLRANMADHIKKRYPDVVTHIADCQEELPFSDHFFDRILAIHVLEHLPNLPAAIKEMHRLCNKKSGVLSVVIPCEGGLTYRIARYFSAQRVFEKRYNQSYKWFIEREHINTPTEIITELATFFEITQRTFFPFIVPSIHLNLCIGLTLKPRNTL